MKSLALALVLAIGLATVAEAAIQRKEDRAAGVLFRLNGTHLTMKLREQGNPRTVKKLVGRTVTAACGTSTTGSGGVVVDAEFTWPRDRSTFAVDFPRDISRRVAYCVVEDPRAGRDIAVVQFR
jgi:hypothetical protein